MDYGGNEMQESLGFIMDRNGNIFYFGQWVEHDKIEKKNRKHFHTLSFEDEVESTEYFQSLNLIYKKEENHWLINEATNLSSQGIILGLNNTYYKEETEIRIFAPTDLTDFQRISLSNLYKDLKEFKSIKIKPAKSIFSKEEFEYKSVDDYFEDYGIEIQIPKK